jgi:hypothetical protein
MSALISTIVGSIAIALVSTLGDFIWATWIPRHRPVYGLTHGTLLFLVVGLYLGVLTRQPAQGAIMGATLGFLAAGSFYVLAPLAGYSVMFVSWFGIWIALALAYAWLSGGPWSNRAVVLRGLAAATASGLAFYLVSGIWRPFNPVGRDYAWHFAAWTFAYFPGFASLLMAPAGRARRYTAQA